MKTLAKYVKPEKYEIEIAITLTMEEWNELKDNIPDKYPFYQLQARIREAIAELTKVTTSNRVKNDD